MVLNWGWWCGALLLRTNWNVHFPSLCSFALSHREIHQNSLKLLKAALICILVKWMETEKHGRGLSSPDLVTPLPITSSPQGGGEGELAN